MKTLAIKIAPDNGFTGIGTLGTPTGNGVTQFSKFISMAIGVMTIVAFIWFIFVLITGAIGIIGSGGDKQSLETAKKKITTGIIGLVVTIAAVFIISLIGTILGIDLLDLGSLFGTLV
jgi:hypothetical protein